MALEENIGKIRLDLSKYTGEDLYNDGDVEEELLEIVREHRPEEYGAIILERASWPVLYHLSLEREAIVRALPIDKKDKVLEVGAGCGAITGALCDMAGSVDACDLSRRRCTINAYRHASARNLTIRVGNFTDVEKDLPADYDWILLIGVLEYGALYIRGEHPYRDFLMLLKKHLKSGGHIAIAIENRLGMKYWAGCREDHLSTFFSGIENYAGCKEASARTFSKPALKKLFHEAGFDDYDIAYPYPDYKFMHTLYTDDHLPEAGLLRDNVRNFDTDRLKLFDERAAFDGMIDDGLFPLYSNSFLAILGTDSKASYFESPLKDRPLYERCTLRSMVDVLGRKSLDVRTCLGKEDGRRTAKVYPYDLQGGVSESTAYELPAGETDGHILAEIRVEPGRRCLRLDPCSEGCTVTVLKAELREQDKVRKIRKIVTNGRSLGGETYLFTTDDPNMIVHLPSPAGQDTRLILELAVAYL